MKSPYFLILASLLTCILTFAAIPCLGEEISIEDAVICREVTDRMPIGAGDVFSSDLTKVMCFTRVVGASGETEILHNWHFQNQMVSSVALHVGSSNFRTYSSKNIIPAYKGEWKVEILSQKGELLKKIIFMIE